MTLRTAAVGPADLLALHAHAPQRYPFLLQSVAGHPSAGRYDILFAFPQAHISSRDGVLQASGTAARGADFFSALSAWAADTAGASVPAELPFAGGWFLLLGYEAAGLIEPRLQLPASPYSLPDALAVRCPAALITDHQQGQTWLVAEHEAGQIEAMAADLRMAPPLPDRVDVGLSTLIEEPPQRYLDGIARIHEYLAAGDVFQVNLSRRWRAQISAAATPVDYYRRLRRSNPAPFAGLARWGDAAVLSSSPERLVQAGQGRVQTRPIAGTHPRSDDPAQDASLRRQLIASLKERAEHIMLIDLERNDLGRVCVPGSVEVSELMAVESYAHVHHIVSNVRGRLRDGVGPGEILRAVFPGGTITGCPKVRTMEIIAELEAEGRGPYTGAMAYLGRDGRLDSNILIRSLIWAPGELSFRAGGGIVADSDPETELAETRAKARGLLLALGDGG